MTWEITWALVLALARSIFRKGGDFTAAMAFEFASTNLVIELGIVLALLIGWQFTLAEFIGGPLMVVLLALLFRAFLSPRLLDLVADDVTTRIYRDQQLVLDGLGRGLQGHLRRVADRRRPGGMGAELFLA